MSQKGALWFVIPITAFGLFVGVRDWYRGPPKEDSPEPQQTAAPSEKAAPKFERGKSYRVRRAAIGVLDLADRAKLLEFVNKDKDDAIHLMIVARRAGAVSAGETVTVLDVNEGFSTGLWVQVPSSKSMTPHPFLTQAEQIWVQAKYLEGN